MARLSHDWLSERHDYDNGDTNIIWAFAYIETAPFKVGIQSFRYDGLPLLRIDLGWIAIGYGKTHEWFCCDKG